MHTRPVRRRLTASGERLDGQKKRFKTSLQTSTGDSVRHAHGQLRNCWQRTKKNAPQWKVNICACYYIVTLLKSGASMRTLIVLGVKASPHIYACSLHCGCDSSFSFQWFCGRTIAGELSPFRGANFAFERWAGGSIGVPRPDRWQLVFLAGKRANCSCIQYRAILPRKPSTG